MQFYASRAEGADSSDVWEAIDSENFADIKFEKDEQVGNPTRKEISAATEVNRARLSSPTVLKGSFAPPSCCESPWIFDAMKGTCILNLRQQGVSTKYMKQLCEGLGFELESETCIRRVRLC
ncbi:unnamed protein product [Thelazia callipaeda]|uniref:Ski_Sno domain-containing protein n=1 Tax=Thelazia callipaeda TaxID=103827 RepID=A0A0N5CQT1_THECL|nr:unnamed protein product [Thelazia callipaeda]